SSEESAIEVDEQRPDGGRVDGGSRDVGPADSAAATTSPPVADARPAPAESSPAAVAVAPPDDDDEPPPELVWYVLKVQSGREDTIRDALQKRVKIQGLQRFFGQIVVPTEKMTEIRNN